MKRMFRALLNLIFPESCCICRKEGPLLCEECIEKIEPCESMPETEHIDRFLCAGVYEGVLKKAVGQFKFEGKKGIAPILGDLMAERLPPESGGDLLIIAVPLHKSRLKERGFNQAQLLAQAVSERTGIAAAGEIVRRTKKTQALHSLSREKRKKTMTGAFTLAGEIPAEKNILLIDDIVTTGTTLQEIAALLKKNNRRPGFTVTALTAAAAPRKFS